MGFVVLLLFSVPFFGFIFLLPNLFSGLPLALHLTWSLLLAANTYFNFAAAVLRPPGALADMLPFTSALIFTNIASASVAFSISLVDDCLEWPGPVEFEMPQTKTPVGKGAFDICMFCTHCRQVKPPQAHHCR